MNLISIGRVVNTHALKGEIKIKSDFEYKNEVFKVNNILYILGVPYKINSYRVHKGYDMVTLDSITSIEDAIKLKSLEVYINKDDYIFSGYLKSDLIGLDVYDKDIYKGKIISVESIPLYDILVIKGSVIHKVPNISKFVKNIDMENKIINIEYIKGLDNED